MSTTIRIISAGSYQEGSARARWYERLKEFDGRPLDEFVASVEAEPPSTPDTGKLAGQLEPVSGWINFFKKKGVLEIDQVGAEKLVTFTLPKIDEEIVLTRQNVIDAIEDLDAGADHHFSEARGYELRHEGRTYWPKAVFGVAISKVLNREIFPSHFKGGEGSKCFRELRRLGFEIGEKTVPEGRADWSEEEVRLLVEDYFDMWAKEQAGIPYNKTKHRENLVENGLNRSKGSIEFKHQNVSAVLSREGVAYITGYKPRSNYQAILEDVVAEYLDTNNAELVAALEQSETEGADPTDVAVDYEKFVDDPPEPQEPTPPSSKTRVARKTDFSARDERNRKLGRAGEEIILDYEKWRLAANGQANLASKVRWVSEIDGDGLGYDIESFDEQGRKIFIEVKTTKSGKDMPFLISANEVEASAELGPQYRIYRVFGYPKSPKVFIINGPVSEVFDLTPRQYQARLKAQLQTPGECEGP